MLKKILYAIGGIVAVFLLIVIAFALYVSKDVRNRDRSAPIAESSIVHIRPDFQEHEGRLVINNTDSFAYQDIVVTINDDFTYKTPRIGSHGSLPVLWREFATEDGQRYSPLTTKLMSLKMTVKTPDGKTGLIVKERP